MSSFQGQTAFDIFQYEQVDAHEFLHRRPLNILVKAGDAWYAYERHILFEYMKARKAYLTMNCAVYDTPNLQSITEEALESLLHFQHVIYELKHERYVDSIQKSVCTLHCYSMDQWERGVIGNTYSPPATNDSSLNLHHIREQLIEELDAQPGMEVEWYREQLQLIDFMMDVLNDVRQYFNVQQQPIQ